MQLRDEPADGRRGRAGAVHRGAHARPGRPHPARDRSDDRHGAGGRTGPDHRRRPPPSRRPARRRARSRSARRAAARPRGRGRPARLFGLTEPAGTRSTRPTTTLPPAPCASSPQPAAARRSRRSPASGSASSRRATARSSTRHRRAAYRGARAGPHGRRLRCHGCAGGTRGAGPVRGRAALPAPLPGRPRGRAVPRAVRGRDRGLRRACSAPTSSDWRPSPTATASARPTSRTTRPTHQHRSAADTRRSAQ